MYKHLWKFEGISWRCQKCRKDLLLYLFKLFELDNKYSAASIKDIRSETIRGKIDQKFPCPISDEQYENEKIIKDIIT